MTERKTHSCTLGLISGAVLFASNLICAELPYYIFPDKVFRLLFSISVATGGVNVILLLLGKRRKFGSVILRLICMHISFGGLLVLNGYLGTVRFLHELFGVIPSSSADNVSGMLSLTFIAFMVLISILSTVLAGIISICIEIGKNKKHS